MGKAAIYDGKYAIQTGSYGAEARGTAAKSDVIISDRNIAFPQVRNCNILLAISETALQEHVKSLREDGCLLIDHVLIKEAPRFPGKIFSIPANRTSEKELGSPLYTNMVMLGALTSVTGVVTAEAVEKSIADYVRQSELEKNLKAFRLGLSLPAKTSAA